MKNEPDFLREIFLNEMATSDSHFDSHYFFALVSFFLFLPSLSFYLFQALLIIRVRFFLSFEASLSICKDFFGLSVYLSFFSFAFLSSCALSCFVPSNILCNIKGNAEKKRRPKLPWFFFLWMRFGFDRIDIEVVCHGGGTFERGGLRNTENIF